ncbi:MAG: hypothetical protein QT03_C0001G0152 [archaeon GW2011_AR10]|uniref:DUF4350 domain-containing protein n=1 Tax=Candidatus Iainarchaeum sp. TaxID=3101447 RepID=A0A7J4IUG4_9ARCH|nr:MAG: hypothetical protein QT03_C0001G0152 [archaeon GW2011_AR10]HIH08480.1 hypothetical protein [Candidatus Diapherotrites archaeon]
MVYPEGGAEGGQEYYPPADFKGKVGYHLEGVIPLILILIILFFVAIRFDIITSSTPLVGPIAEIFEGGAKPSSMLIIGATSQEVLDVLNDNDDLIRYRIKTADSLRRNPREQLAQYDIVMLDQSQEANKEVSRELGEGIEKYVAAGGNLIVVLDSGIRRPGAFDVIGWENTFGQTVPVSCDRVINDIPVCLDRRIVRGKLYREDEDHPILRGIEAFPAEPELFAIFETFDVTPTGKEIAYIQEASAARKTYPAIVEKPTLVGKSIYFNYNPGITRGILESTLRYMR